MDQTFFDAYYSAYNSEDIDKLADFYSDDIVLCYDNNTHMGRTAVIETYKYIQSMFEDRMEMNSFFVQGNKAVVELENRFVARADIKDFMGRDLSAGESFRMNLVAEYTFSRGKISNLVIRKK